MVMFKPWQTSVTKNLRLFTEEKIFFLTNIREVYVVLAIAAPIEYWFANNYVDLDQFNTLYDKDFKKKKMHTANKVAAQFK